MPERERKTVTARFVDIKASTELMEGLDPEKARATVDPALKIMIDAVHRYDGYIMQSSRYCDLEGAKAVLDQLKG